MSEDFTTVLTSQQPALIAQAAAILESAGIPYQQPGYQHASLMPQVNFIKIELRVPTDRVEEARRALGDIDELMRDGSEGRPVFRVQRHAGATFAIIGGLIGALAALALLTTELDFRVWLAPLVLAGFPLIGFIMGSGMRVDYCSAPGCPGELSPAAVSCPRCKGIVRGRINHASQHLASAEAFEQADP
ncbi:MAG: DUF2007 domain-containing protein [Deltaproteobacteria bacterium]|nr:DUF2007 domain-containing protein [Deltaproteobacteria bacterium]